MAWSSAFLEQLASKQMPPIIWVAEVIDLYNTPGDVGYTFSNTHGWGDEVLIGAPPSFAGSRLTPVSWSSTIGGFSLDLVGDLTTFLQKVTRGTAIALKAAFLGGSTSDLQLMSWGLAFAVEGKGGRWKLDVRDPISSLTARPSLTVNRLFSGIGTTSALNGAITDTDTSIVVLDATAFHRETGGTGAILIEEEIITYTGVSGGTTFTGCTRGCYGTTAAAHADTTTVTELALLQGHPLNVAMRLLISRTGDGSNGAYDDYPAYWGFGLAWPYVDTSDIEKWRDTVVKVASGTYQWDVVVDSAQESPASWFTSLFATAGIYPTVRQGKLTVRGGSWGILYTAPPYLSDYAITDSDILADGTGWDGIEQSAWDADSAEAYIVSIATASGTSSPFDPMQTVPTTYSVTYDVSDQVWTNETEVRAEMAARLQHVAQRVPEGLLVTCAGMRFAALAPGDVVSIYSERLEGRFASAYHNAGGGLGAKGRTVMVTQVSPDFGRNRVQLRLLAFPSTSDVFPP